MQSHSEILGIRVSTYGFWRDTDFGRHNSAPTAWNLNLVTHLSFSLPFAPSSSTLLTVRSLSHACCLASVTGAIQGSPLTSWFPGVQVLQGLGLGFLLFLESLVSVVRSFSTITQSPVVKYSFLRWTVCVRCT